jgi:hypothetical protein
MPDAEEIIQGLFMITNAYTWAAIAWHAFIYLLIAALILKWKPSNRTLSVLLTLPLLTVSIFAWITGNPFNGSLFLVFAILLIILGLGNPESVVATGHTWSTVMGILILIFGLLYPHFLDTENYFTYLYAAPTGLIPCPTLSVIIGFAILFKGFQSRAWAWVLVIPGLIYGLIGTFRLQVFLDMVLLLATVILILTTFRLPKKQIP